MVIHDVFFWFTLIFGLILFVQVVGLAICIGPIYRTYRAFRSLGSIQKYQKQSTLRQKLGHG